MKTVGITGAAGFLGWHIRCRLHAAGIPTVEATRETFADPARLTQFCQSADVIVHVAGVNRAASDQDVLDGNRNLASQLVSALERSGGNPALVYTNSTQSENDSPYGRSKREASELLAAHCERSGAVFLDLVLPHVFGEFGKPHYNSVVSTFAFALANNDEVSVNRTGELELIHAQAVALRIDQFVTSPTAGSERILGEEISVGEVWDRLQHLHNRYVHDGTVPLVDDALGLGLFNTLRSQLYQAGFYPRPVTLHTDQRGAFAELCRADGTGQTSISTSGVGITRGDHFHFDKIERFIVVQGSAELRLRRLLTNEVQTYRVSGDQPVLIDMPPLVTHNITNTGDDTAVTVFWAGDHFDPNVPDTFAEPVEIDA